MRDALGRKEKGRQGEARAAAFLKRHGYKILCRGWQTRYGEVDIIAREGEVLCFIEVKSRKQLRFGLPTEAVSPQKMKRLALCAQAFISQHRLAGTPLRFDVVSILEREGKTEIELFRGAFDNPLPWD